MRCCSKKVLYGYVLFILLGLFLYSNTTKADEHQHVYPNTMYMKISEEIGGYITITTELCEIESKKNEYSYKAILQDGNGDTRRGCWYRAEPPHKGLYPLVLIVEEIKTKDKDRYDIILYNVGSIAQYYFKESK